MIDSIKNFKKNIYNDDCFDAIVVGAGHAGIEAACALANLGKSVLLTTISLDSVGFLACNPSIGGTGKSHLVKELDALGGQMAKLADKTAIQARMLNTSKGQAVQSLRVQVDKQEYHKQAKKLIENKKNIFLRQCQVLELIVENSFDCLDKKTTVKKVVGIKTTLEQEYYAPVVILCCGVYLDSLVLIGKQSISSGPAGFANSIGLSDNLKSLGLPFRRFKTGTPARLDGKTIDYNKLDIQYGQDNICAFSEMTTIYPKNKAVCYLGYTNLFTHAIIKNNLHLTLKYSGQTSGVGARYCPSIEDKIVKFSDKDSHSFFLEREGLDTNEVYIQGISTSLPPVIQKEMYRSISGLETVDIMRDAYAIEYECIDPLSLLPSLMIKSIQGLFSAGQINGTSGYEEAAAQGIVAGINASRYIDRLPWVIFDRCDSYIGVMIDDLVTIGTDEPYRMMTSRSENRLKLRQDNSVIRLSPLGIDIGLVDTVRKNRFKAVLKQINFCHSLKLKTLPMEFVNNFLVMINENQATQSMTLDTLIKRERVTAYNLKDACKMYLKTVGNMVAVNNKTKSSFNIKDYDIKDYDGNSVIYAISSMPLRVLDTFVADIKYSGYIARLEKEQIQINQLSQMAIDIVEFDNIPGLSQEASEKLAKIQPLTIAQASRISGVNPTDINALIIHIKTRLKKQLS